MRIIGLDLSLASTGIASYEATGAVSARVWVDTVRTRAIPGDRAQFARLRQITTRVVDDAQFADLVVVEGLSYASTTGQHLTRAGLWHLVMDGVDSYGIPWCEVSPGAVKRYATGNGGAAKDQVLAAVIRRYPDVAVADNNQADALTIVAMAAHHYQCSTLPTVPQAHATALAKVDWPKGVR
jgi:crossover junction endodeoxyribonuclease RuvC